MLVPLDGSEFAEAVFPYAKELVARLGMTAVLLHIVPSEERGFFAPIHRAYVRQTADSIREQAAKVQEKIGVQPERNPVRVEGETVTGSPGDEILRYAETKSVDLILMATHGRTGARHWALGRVAERVLRQSKVPVWVVRADVPDAMPYDRWPKKTLVVTLDGSELAESILTHVEALAQQNGEAVEVVLVMVCEPPVMPTYEGQDESDTPPDWTEYVLEEEVLCRKTAAEYLGEIEKRLKERNITVRSEVLAGKASEAIIDYATRNPQSMIMMTTHGRTGLRRLVYGSVAESVLLGVSNPIFLVRTR